MNEITLPIELAHCKNRFDGLSLREIGAVFVLMSLPHLPNDVRDVWSDSAIFQDVLQKMIHDGILKKSEDLGGNLTIEIDITKVSKYE